MILLFRLTYESIMTFKVAIACSRSSTNKPYMQLKANYAIEF